MGEGMGFWTSGSVTPGRVEVQCALDRGFLRKASVQPPATQRPWAAPAGASRLTGNRFASFL